MLARVNKLIEDVKRDPFAGIGKPEPLAMMWPRICPSLWTGSPGSVGGRVVNGVKDLVQTPRHTD